MFKTKLFASICAAASAVTVATTALTLSIAGPAGVQSIHTHSANDAIASSIAGVFSSAGDTAEGISNFVEVITNNKTATNIGFTINSIEGYEELSGVGGSLELQLDTENEAAALILEATLGSVEVIDGTLYVDKNEVLAAVPTIFDGVLKASLDNLEEDLENSLIGELILDGSDYEELEESFALLMSEYETMAPSIDFDSEKFMDGLTDTMNDAFNDAMDNMEAKDLGKKKLNGGSYQCYDAKIPVKDLSYILRDAIKYCLESEEFQSLVDQLVEYSAEQSGDDYLASEFSGEMLSQYSAYIDTYWGMVVSSLEEVLGENIELTVYITDTVELAGFAMDIYVLGDTLSYNDANADDADLTMNLMCDCTGGKNIGDYTDISMTLKDEYDTVNIAYVQKYETNGDFDIDFTFETDDDESIAITADGNYVVDGDFFSFVIDSIKFIENDTVIGDFGLSVSFKPIDAVTKPSGEPVYDIWEMDEDDFVDLLTEIEGKLEEFTGLFE